MPRLSETLCKAKKARNVEIKLAKKVGDHLQINKSRQIRAVPALRNQVSVASIVPRKTACLDELAVLMNCWKKHDFAESSCMNEIARFNTCQQNYEVKLKEMKEQAATSELGGKGTMNPRQANRLLKMYPQPPYKISFTSSNTHRMPKNGMMKPNSKNSAQGLWGLNKDYKWSGYFQR